MNKNINYIIVCIAYIYKYMLDNNINNLHKLHPGREKSYCALRRSRWDSNPRLLVI